MDNVTLEPQAISSKVAELSDDDVLAWAKEQLAKEQLAATQAEQDALMREEISAAETASREQLNKTIAGIMAKYGK